MEKQALMTFLSGEIIDEHCELSLVELCRASHLSADQVIELVDYGILEPIENQQMRWRFSGSCLQRVRSAVRLQRDLGINTAGVALALELLDEVSELRQRLQRQEKR